MSQIVNSPRSFVELAIYSCYTKLSNVHRVNTLSWALNKWLSIWRSFSTKKALKPAKFVFLRQNLRYSERNERRGLTNGSTSDKYRPHTPLFKRIRDISGSYSTRMECRWSMRQLEGAERSSWLSLLDGRPPQSPTGPESKGTMDSNNGSICQRWNFFGAYKLHCIGPFYYLYNHSDIRNNMKFSHQHT